MADQRNKEAIAPATTRSGQPALVAHTPLAATDLLRAASQNSHLRWREVGSQVIATSVNSTVTGKGADFIIVDDPHNVREAHSDTIRQSTIDWFRSSLISRTNDSAKACFIVVQQRVHPSDLAGYLIDQGGWEHLNLPAIADTDQEIQTSENKTILFKKGDLLNPARLSTEILEQKNWKWVL